MGRDSPPRRFFASLRMTWGELTDLACEKSSSAMSTINRPLHSLPHYLETLIFLFSWQGFCSSLIEVVYSGESHFCKLRKMPYLQHFSNVLLSFCQGM